MDTCVVFRVSDDVTDDLAQLPTTVLSIIAERLVARGVRSGSVRPGKGCPASFRADLGAMEATVIMTCIERATGRPYLWSSIASWEDPMRWWKRWLQPKVPHPDARRPTMADVRTAIAEIVSADSRLGGFRWMSVEEWARVSTEDPTS